MRVVEKIKVFFKRGKAKTEAEPKPSGEVAEKTGGAGKQE